MFFDDVPLQKTPKAQRKPDGLKRIIYKRAERYWLTREEIFRCPQGTEVVIDTEQFSNYQFIGFKLVGYNGYFFLQRRDDELLDAQFLNWVLYHFKSIGFNSRNYDVPILAETLRDKHIQEIKNLSDAIILRGERTEWHERPIPYDHVDLIEVAPLQGSLKLYAARLHCQRMQEMPVDTHKPLTPEEQEGVADYCCNDLDNTELLYLDIKAQIDMREEIGRSIGQDLRSKSDAQLAEAVLSVEYQRLTGQRPKKPKEIDQTPIPYRPPSYIQFRTKLLQDTFNSVCATMFDIDANGYVELPEAFEKLQLPIGNNVFRMSIGGLHSTETSMLLRSDSVTSISDFDVASYYPRIVLNGGLFPPSMGADFLKVYETIVTRRLKAKDAAKVAHDAGDKAAEKLYLVQSDGLKITINGTFGKFGNFYSIMYSPELMLYVTLTGQFTLLMLIEHAALEGFEIVSANTDGVVFRYPTSREAELQAIVNMWEQQTSFKLEKTSYQLYAARDVNNYMTLKHNGEWKTKGAYCERGSAQNSVLSRNPEAFICVDAVKSFLEHKVPIEATIHGSKDMRRFVTIRNVKGGAHKDGFYLGKVVRWYYAEGVSDAIYSVLSGSQVAKTEGSKPLMELGAFPADLDYNWYINSAFDILRDIGYYGTNEQKRLL